jgi:hypothetical protein
MLGQNFIISPSLTPSELIFQIAVFLCKILNVLGVIKDKNCYDYLQTSSIIIRNMTEICTDKCISHTLFMNSILIFDAYQLTKQCKKMFTAIHGYINYLTMLYELQGYVPVNEVRG